MRLIDADLLKEKIIKDMEFLQKGLGKDAKYAHMASYSVLKDIDAQPTAYDVDKVVEHLENEHINCYRPGDYKYNNGIDKAIEIVKAGGINE